MFFFCSWRLCSLTLPKRVFTEEFAVEKFPTPTPIYVEHHRFFSFFLLLIIYSVMVTCILPLLTYSNGNSFSIPSHRSGKKKSPSPQFRPHPKKNGRLDPANTIGRHMVGPLDIGCYIIRLRLDD